MALEVTSVFEACRANARRQTEIGVVGDRNRLVVIFDLDYACHRTKDFLARNPHAVVNLGEQRRLQIEAGIVAVENLAAPVEQIGKSTRLNSSHTVISYAVFCLKKKKKKY